MDEWRPVTTLDASEPFSPPPVLHLHMVIILMGDQTVAASESSLHVHALLQPITWCPRRPLSLAIPYYHR